MTLIDQFKELNMITLENLKDTWKLCEDKLKDLTTKR